MSFWRLYYHLIWGTRNRYPTLTGEIEATAERVIRSTCRDLDLIFYALGIMPEHVHLVVGIPPRLSVSEAGRRLKGSSSHLLNQVKGESAWFGWQNEYGVLSFGERSLDRIVTYVNNQQLHHMTGELMPAFEQLESEHPMKPRVETRD